MPTYPYDPNSPAWEEEGYNDTADMGGRTPDLGTPVSDIDYGDWRDDLDNIRWTGGNDVSNEYYLDPETNLPVFNPDSAERNPDNMAGHMAYADWKYQQAFYRPLEREAIRRIQDPADVERKANFAGGTMSQQHRLGREAQERDLQRQGIGLSFRQRNQTNRSNNLARAKDVAFAENSTRQNQEDINRQAGHTMAGLGRNVASGAIDSMGQMGTAHNAKEAAYRAAQQNSKNNLIGLGATAIGTILSI